MQRGEALLRAFKVLHHKEMVWDFILVFLEI